MDDIRLDVIQQTIDVTFKRQTIEITFPIMSGIVHTHTMAQVVSDPFVEATFANPLDLSAAYYKSYHCTITGNTTVNLLNAINGDDGMITLDIDNVGGYTVLLGTMFTTRMGMNTINTFPGKTNIITWRKMFDEILYTIAFEEEGSSNPDYVSYDDIFEHETVSRTIYVTATGNDTTGDGSIGLPFLTIGKALSSINVHINLSVIVTINLGAGSYNFTPNDRERVSAMMGHGTLEFLGNLTLVDSGFTVGAAQALDPLTYAVSGGNTASWTTDQWKFYLLMNTAGTAYFPITNNTNATISIPMGSALVSTNAQIYNRTATLNFSGQSNTDRIFKHSIQLNFTKLNITISEYSEFYSLGLLLVKNCHLTPISAEKDFIFMVGSKWSVIQSSTNGIGFMTYTYPDGSLNINYIKKNSRYCLSVPNPNVQSGFGSFFNNVFESGTVEAIQCVGSILHATNSQNNYYKFINCNVAISLTEWAIFKRFRTTAKIILVNTAYLFNRQSITTDYDPIQVQLKYENIYGTPTIRWFYNSMLEFVNPTSGRNVQITGLIFPEFEQNLTATLTNNTTTNVIIGNKLQNRSIHVDYTITRSSGYRSGYFDIVNDGTSLYMSPDEFISNNATGVDDSAIFFDSNFNSNEIRMSATLNNYTSATINYNVRRVMITPLTI